MTTNRTTPITPPSPTAPRTSEPRWYVLRDLNRPNSSTPAWRRMEELGLHYFTPMVWQITTVSRRKVRRRAPVIRDLLFVREPRTVLDPIITATPTLQYRYERGAFQSPMTVRDADMERFIAATTTSAEPQYLCPSEVTASMRNRRIRIIGGRLNGYEGTLVTTRGSKIKRLLVEIPGLLAATVEVEPEYIELL